MLPPVSHKGILLLYLPKFCLGKYGLSYSHLKELSLQLRWYSIVTSHNAKENPQSSIIPPNCMCILLQRDDVIVIFCYSTVTYCQGEIPFNFPGILIAFFPSIDSKVPPFGSLK